MVDLYFILDNNWVAATVDDTNIAYVRAHCGECDKEFVVKMKAQALDRKYERMQNTLIKVTYQVYPIGNFGRIVCPYCGEAHYNWNEGKAPK